MFKNLSGARLGLFVFIGTVLLVIAIFLIGNKDALFQSTFEIKAYFKTVEGLRTGASVRLSGIDVGSVDDIIIASDTSGRVIVLMRINEDVHNFIRIDSYASIETEGLVGNKIVVLSVGSATAKRVENGGFVRAKTPISITQIITESQGTLNYVKDITRDFSEIVSKINRGEGTIGKIVNDDKLYNAAAQITESADKSLNSITASLEEVSSIIIESSAKFNNIVGSIDSIVTKIDFVVTNVKQGKGVIGSLLADKSSYDDSIKAIIKNLVTTTSEVKLGASRFAENMEALKHNWLFKSYFEQRGYWDIDEYEKNLDTKIMELKERTRTLDQRIKELRELEATSSKSTAK